MGEVHNVFISHRHEDDALVAGFKELLAGKDVQIRDASITRQTPNQASNPNYIKTQILAPGIQWAGKIVVLITPDTKNHDWVDWEIEYANKQDKQIIGVWAPGSAGCAVPDPLEKYADAIVGWDSDRILEALDGAQMFEDSSGLPRPPQPIERVRC